MNAQCWAVCLDSCESPRRLAITLRVKGFTSMILTWRSWTQKWQLFTFLETSEYLKNLVTVPILLVRKFWGIFRGCMLYIAFYFIRIVLWLVREIPWIEVNLWLAYLGRVHYLEFKVPMYIMFHCVLFCLFMDYHISQQINRPPNFSLDIHGLSSYW